MKIHLLQRSVRCSSLLEAVVAMTILSVVLGIAMTLYLKVSYSAISGQKIKAQLIINRLAVETIKEKRYLSEQFENENISLIKEVSKYNQSDRLLLLHIKAFNSHNDLITEYREIILPNNE